MINYDVRCDGILGWCEQCKEVVELVVEEDTDTFDGVRCTTDVSYYCPYDKNHNVVGISQCPICGNDMGENDSFCEDCYEIVRLALNSLKEELDCSQDDFEEIIANHFGW